MRTVADLSRFAFPPKTQQTETVRLPCYDLSMGDLAVSINNVSTVYRIFSQQKARRL
jgi:hypothetical protein